MDDYISLSDKAIAKARDVGDGRPVDLIGLARKRCIVIRSGNLNPAFPFHGSQSNGRQNHQRRSMLLLILFRHLGAPVLVGIDRAYLGG